MATFVGCGVLILENAPSYGQSFTISNGQAETTQQTVGPGGTGLIEALGSLTVDGTSAITNAGDGAVVNIFGTITSTGFFLNTVNLASSNTVTSSGTISSEWIAIFALDNNVILNRGNISAHTAIVARDNNTITNLGKITVECCGIAMRNNNIVTNGGTINSQFDGIVGEDGNTITNSATGIISALEDGIFVDDNNVIENHGQITATDSDGIEAYDGNRIFNSSTGVINAYQYGITVISDNVVINNGSITTKDNDGIDAYDNNTIQNNGTVVAEDDAIDVHENNTITNTGTLISLDDEGIELEGPGNTVTNSGTIIGDDFAIKSEEAGNTVINSGAIANSNGPTATAIMFEGTGADRLVFLGSPLTVGKIVFDDDGRDDTAEFLVAGGRSLDVTFSALPDNLVHDASRQSTVVDRANNRVVYVDPTGFAASSVWLDSLTRSVADTLANSTDSASGNPSATNAYFLQAGDGTAGQSAEPNRLWASGFFTGGKQQASDTNGELTNRLGGVLFGMDADVSAQTRVGLFGGVATGRVIVQNNRQSIDTDSAFGGAYAHWQNDNLFNHFSLLAGFSEQRSKRDVANNLVVGGIETAQADYSAFYISQAFTVGGQLAELETGQQVVASLRVHYAGLFQQSYSESGVASPVSVNDRDIHRFGGRAQVSLPGQTIGPDGSTVQMEHRAGIDYVFSPDSQTVSGSVAGQSLSFDASYDTDGPAGFIGAEFTRTLPGGNRKLKAGGELRVTTDGSFELRSMMSYKATF